MRDVDDPKHGTWIFEQKCYLLRMWSSHLYFPMSPNFVAMAPSALTWIKKKTAMKKSFSWVRDNYKKLVFDGSFPLWNLNGSSFRIGKWRTSHFLLLSATLAQNGRSRGECKNEEMSAKSITFFILIKFLQANWSSGKTSEPHNCICLSKQGQWLQNLCVKHMVLHIKLSVEI